MEGFLSSSCGVPLVRSRAVSQPLVSRRLAKFSLFCSIFSTAFAASSLSKLKQLTTLKHIFHIWKLLLQENSKNRHSRMRQIDATDKCEVYGILQKCGYFQRKFSRAPLTKEKREEFNRIGNQNWKTWLKSAGTFIWTDRRVEMLLKILCNCECEWRQHHRKIEKPMEAFLFSRRNTPL